MDRDRRTGTGGQGQEDREQGQKKVYFKPQINQMEFPL